MVEVTLTIPIPRQLTLSLRTLGSLGLPCGLSEASGLWGSWAEWRDHRYVCWPTDKWVKLPRQCQQKLSSACSPTLGFPSGNPRHGGIETCHLHWVLPQCLTRRIHDRFMPLCFEVAGYTTMIPEKTHYCNHSSTPLPLSQFFLFTWQKPKPG